MIREYEVTVFFNDKEWAIVPVTREVSDAEFPPPEFGDYIEKPIDPCEFLTEGTLEPAAPFD